MDFTNIFVILLSSILVNNFVMSRFLSLIHISAFTPSKYNSVASMSSALQPCRVNSRATARGVL